MGQPNSVGERLPGLFHPRGDYAPFPLLAGDGLPVAQKERKAFQEFIFAPIYPSTGHELPVLLFLVIFGIATLGFKIRASNAP